MRDTRREDTAGCQRFPFHPSTSTGRLNAGDSNLLKGGEPPSIAQPSTRHKTASMPGVSEYKSRKANQDRGPLTPFETPGSRPCPGIAPSQPIAGFKPGSKEAPMGTRQSAPRQGEAASIHPARLLELGQEGLQRFASMVAGHLWREVIEPRATVEGLALSEEDRWAWAEQISRTLSRMAKAGIPVSLKNLLVSLKWGNA